MKRCSTLKRGTKSIKRSKLKKQSKQSISLIQRKIWILCREIIRRQYGNTCYTCGTKGLAGSNWHTSHLFPKAALGAYLKYDLRLLRPACYNCNINLGGNGAVFYQRMLRDCGTAYMEKLEQDKKVTVNAMEHYQKLIVEYTEELTKLQP